MDKREVKRFACCVAAVLLHQEAWAASDLCEDLSNDDLGRVQEALIVLSKEMYRRGSTEPQV